jgi:hypothetical protein
MLIGLHDELYGKRPLTRQIEIQTAEPLVPDPRPFVVEIAIEKLKRYTSPGSNQILAELIQAGCEILHSKIHELITSIWNTEKLPDQWKESIIIPVHKKGDKTDCGNIGGYHYYQFRTKFYRIFFSQGSVHMLMRLLGIISVGFDVTDQLLIRSSAFVKYWRRNGSTIRQHVSYS